MQPLNRDNSAEASPAPDGLEGLRLIDRRQLAALLGISPKTLSNRKARRDIPDPIHRGRLLDADEWNRRRPKRK